MAGLMNPILQQLVKNIQQPKFDDLVESWPSFMWDFNEYLRKLSPVSPVQGALKLALFEDAMPITLKGEIKLMRKKNGGNLTFAEVIAKFENRYGMGGSGKLRKKWQEISLPTSGKVTSRQLREFQVNFLACADDIKDLVPSEVRRMVLQKLPPFMGSWVIESERRLERENPIVQVHLKDGLREADILHAIKLLVGEAPTAVVDLGRGTFRLKFATLVAAKKMLGMHMREMHGLEKGGYSRRVVVDSTPLSHVVSHYCGCQ